MSKIEVDAIDKQSGSTLTIGGSGTTVQLGTGASQTGFGRTGTVDWQTGSIKTATFTAVSGEGYFCNTAGGAFELDLPAGSAGAIVSIQDYNNTFDSNALTVDPNGSEKINGGSAGDPVILDTKGRGVTFVYIDATVGWRSVQDNDFSKAGATFVTASGGTITTCGNFKIHTFTGPGTFQVTGAGTPGGSNTIDYLVIGGGGGGGQNNAYGDSGRGGGGGAGGYRESSGAASGCYSISPLGACVSALPVAVASYPVTVGAGVGGGYTTKGSDSVFAGSTTITSTGGGTGGIRVPSAPGGPAGAGNPGGSGGGGGTYAGAGPVGSGNTPPVSPPQGSNGGPGTEGPPSYGAGGGGGATAVGITGTTSAGGAGGAGATSSINGTPTTRAGGGGGAVYTGSPVAGAGGSGGGGAGAGRTGPVTTGVNGTANTGGGGGGGGGTCGFGGGGTGGSGVVIIRYKFQ